MYELYFDKVLFPVTPEKITLKIGGANKTITLLDGGEINILKSPKLTDIEFDVLLPNVQYSFAVYAKGFVPAAYYLEQLEKYVTEKQPFQWKLIRAFPNGEMLFDTDMKVSLESYTMKEAYSNAYDIVVSVKLKQYRDFGTKTCMVNYVSAKPTAAVQRTRAASGNAPTTSGKETVVIVKKGDTLWGICKTYLGNGSLYTAVAKENGISNPNLLRIGQKIVLSGAVTASTAGKVKVGAAATSGGSKNKAPFTLLTSSFGVVKANIKTWNEAYGYYMANNGSGKGWKIVDSDRSVISL